MINKLPCQNHYYLLILILISFAFNRCSIENQKIATKTKAAEPHIAWNGSNFGIIYYAGQVMSYPVNLSMALVDKTGDLKKVIKIPDIKPDFKLPGRMTDLIWNNKHKQFAFSYAKDGVIWFFRYDANLDIIGTPYKITQDNSDLFVDISMAYNEEKDEYGLAFICRTKILFDKQHLYFAHFDPEKGNPKGNYNKDWTTLIKGIGSTGVEKTSICYDSNSKKYAIAYYNDKKASVRFFSTPSLGSGFPIANKAIFPESIHIVYDPGSKDFMVLQIDNTGNLTGNIVSPSGKIDKPFFWQNKVDRNLSISTILSDEKHKYILGVSENDVVKSYLINCSGHIDKNLSVPSSNKYGYEPSIIVVGNTSYIAWIQDKQLYFGSPKQKFK